LENLKTDKLIDLEGDDKRRLLERKRKKSVIKYLEISIN